MYLFDGVQRIKQSDGFEFLKRHHYLKGGSVGSSQFGYIHNHELVAVVLFGPPATHSTRASILGENLASNVFELQRLAKSDQCPVELSSFVSQAIKEWKKDREHRGRVRPLALVSFADPNQNHHGGIYQAMSWGYYGLTSTRSSQYRGDDGQIIHRRYNGSNRLLNLPKEPTSYKHRYIKTFNKRVKPLFKTQPYPKPL